MEKIQEHELQDVYRIQDGLLVEVNKYEPIGYTVYPKSNQVKRKRGCKGLQVLQEDITDSYTKITYPKGTSILHYAPVKAISNWKDFKIEVKSSGGCISGSIAEIEKITKIISDIMDTYK